MKIEWTVLAVVDVKRIYAYIKEENPPAAVAVIAAVRRALRGQLQTSPLSGRVGRVKGTRELVIPRTPYIAAYRVTDTGVQILRVLHGAQHWPKTL